MTRVKICGVRFFDDAVAAIEAGAEYLGFNFYPGSIRYIEPSECRKLTGILKSRHPTVKLVGVFVNSPADEIRKVRQTCSLDKIQLHGDESPEIVAAAGVGAYKAFRGAPEHVEPYIHHSTPAFLLDAAAKGVYGGTGLAADWTSAAKLAQQHKFFLAGGLNPENVGDAIRQVTPWGVDVASGVETIPGVKDPQKIKAFIAAVRQADEDMAAFQNPKVLLEDQ